VNGTEKIATLTCKVYNEGQPALAESFTISYSNDGENWTQIDSPSISDLGDGTYTITFNSNDLLDTALVFTRCQDERGIIVQTTVPMS
jgi:hypothetical protein